MKGLPGAIRIGVLSAWTVSWAWAGPKGWVEVKSPHFVALSNAGVSEAKQVLMGFEAVRTVFDSVLPGVSRDSTQPMMVLVMKDEASMKPFLPKQFETKESMRPAGFFQRVEDSSYALVRMDVDHQVDQAYFIVFHEYTHGVLHRNFSVLPTWLDEGLADFYGATEIHRDSIHLGRVPLSRLQTLRERRMPLETQFQVTHDSKEYLEGEKASVFYAQSWALVHYLLSDPKMRERKALGAYLEGLAAGGSPLDVARSAFGDLKGLEQDLWHYISKSSFAYWRVPLKVPLTDADFTSRPANETYAQAIRAELLMGSPWEAEGRTSLEQALAKDPTSPEGLAAMGFLHRRGGRRDEAEAALKAALGQGSQDFRVPLYLAQLGLERSERTPSEASILRGYLEQALRLQPDVPAIHMNLARYYATDPKDPDKVVQEGIQAVKLDPHHFVNRYNLGILCLDLGRLAEARALRNQLQGMVSMDSERRMLASFDGYLAHATERAESSTEPHANQTSVSRSVPRKPLKFSLPSNLAPLGREVQMLFATGNLDEAIQKVREALGKPASPYEKKALNALLEQLDKAKAGKP